MQYFLSPQACLVLEMLRTDGYVTRLTAQHAGVPNLTARISELRAFGINTEVTKHIDPLGRKYSRWNLTVSGIRSAHLNASQESTTMRATISKPRAPAVLGTVLRSWYL
jgi:hypothetical protein